MTWGCFPRWDSDPVFATLLGGEGFYCVRPRDRHVWGGYYEEGSLVWRNRWLSDSSTLECREALSYPGNPQRAVILRRLTALDGDTAVAVDLVLRRSFGAGTPSRVSRDERGGWTARLGELYIRWSGAPGARYDSRSASFRATPVLRDGEQLDLVLEISTTPLDDDPPRADVEWQATEQAWRRAVPTLDAHLARRDVRQAVAVLR